MGQQEVQGGILEEVGEELAKIEVSFSKGGTLKGDNVKIARSELSFSYVFFIFYFHFNLFFFILFLELGLGLE